MAQSLLTVHARQLPPTTAFRRDESPGQYLNPTQKPVILSAAKDLNPCVLPPAKNMSSRPKWPGIFLRAVCARRATQQRDPGYQPAQYITYDFTDLYCQPRIPFDPQIQQLRP